MENHKLKVRVTDLKQTYQYDRLASYLYELALDCKKRRDGFWTQFIQLRFRNNLISIPLIIVSSLTGVTSVANVNTRENFALSITVSVFGVSSAVLSAIQKYFGFAERAEHSRNIAKTYGRIARRIENMMTYIESYSVEVGDETFIKFVEEVEKDIDILLQDVNDNPRHFITNKETYDEFLTKLREMRANQLELPNHPPLQKQTTFSIPPLQQSMYFPYSNTANHNYYREVQNVAARANSAYPGE